jgi:hypothetical protein
VRQALQRWGLLLQTDPIAPSVTTIVARRPVRGSWWGNPAASGTYEVCEALDDAGLFCIKLLSGKLTYVRGDLVPGVAAMGLSDQPWQMQGMSSQASQLLNWVEETGEVRVDRLPPGSTRSNSPAAAARDLEMRLLVHAGNLHTERGAHTKLLQSWTRWAERSEISHLPSAAEAQQSLEATAAAINAEFASTLALPWQRKRPNRSR